MISIIKKAVNVSLKRSSPIIPDSVYRRILGKGKIIGLNYHIVSDAQVKHVRHLYTYKSTDEFERDIKYIRKTYKIVSYNELASAGVQNTLHDNTSIFLSFDDGLSECYHIVRPILLRYEIPCIFFIVTDCIDNKHMCSDHSISVCIDYIRECSDRKQRSIVLEVNRNYGTQLQNIDELIGWVKKLDSEKVHIMKRLCTIINVDIEKYCYENKPYLSESEIKQLAQDGFTIGAHSRRHHKLTACTEQEIESEIVKSCEVIGAITGRSEIPFAFPYNATETIDRNYLERLRETNKIVGLLFHGGGFRTDRHFMVGRITADMPAGKKNGTSNIQRIMNNAYQKEYRWKINELVKPSARV